MNTFARTRGSLAAAWRALKRVARGGQRLTMDAAIRALAARGHGFRTVIDIGASDGRWSEDTMRSFPGCAYLLIEAQGVHRPALERFCAARRNAQFVLAAAGDAPGTIRFDASDPFGGQASHALESGHGIEVPVTTLDHEVEARALPPPYLLKFDTHGFEVPILKGAARVLAGTEVIVMECYNQRISSECLLFHEMCTLLAAHGFRCIDLVDPMHRARDGTFWQMDLVFVRDTRPEFASASYD